jgi:hypothetical protein
MTGASLTVAMIGQALAQARGLGDQARDQAGRTPAQQRWHRCLGQLRPLGAVSVGSRSDIVVAMDWTDFDGDGQATLALNLVTEHGRATLAKVPTAKPLE